MRDTVSEVLIQETVFNEEKFVLFKNGKGQTLGLSFRESLCYDDVSDEGQCELDLLDRNIRYGLLTDSMSIFYDGEDINLYAEEMIGNIEPAGILKGTIANIIIGPDLKEDQGDICFGILRFPEIKKLADIFQRVMFESKYQEWRKIKDLN